MTDDQELLETARQVAANAYAPYSEFRVGAVAVASDGRAFIGVNVENAAYGSTVCAEVTAVTAAATAGVRKLDLVAVAALDGDDVYPCGNCRQLMNEFDVDEVLVEGPDGGPVRSPFESLLPQSFGSEKLAGGT